MLNKIAKRNMKDIVPLYYDMKKANPSIIIPEVLYNGMITAYTTGNIGIYSNNISKIWNSTGEIDKQELDAVKWLVMENNYVIDAAKTLYTPTRPKEVDKIIKQYTKSKLPNFFIYAKDKLPTQVEPANESAMNRIAKQIPTSRIKFCKTVGKFDYRKMMNMDEEFTIQPDHPIIKSYEFWNTHQSLFNEQNEHVSDEDLFKYQSIRENIFKENKEYSADYILNTLLMYLYTFKPNSTKKTLWASFGEMIYHNLERNLDKEEKICPVCGKRFQPRNSLQRCCGMDCGKVYDIRMKKINKNQK